MPSHGNDSDCSDDEVVRYNDQKDTKGNTKKRYSLSDHNLKKKKRHKNGSNLMASSHKKEEESSTTHYSHNYEGEYSGDFEDPDEDSEFRNEHASHDPFYEDLQFQETHNTMSTFDSRAPNDIKKECKDSSSSSSSSSQSYAEEVVVDAFDNRSSDKDLEEQSQDQSESFYEDFNNDTANVSTSFNQEDSTSEQLKGKKRKWNELEKEDAEDYTKSVAKLPTEALDGKKKVQQMMEKMGYQPGKGLGKHQQGRLEPVQAWSQRGRSGLGHKIPEIKPTSLTWDPNEEVIKETEDMEWLPNKHRYAPTTEEMRTWIALGQRKETIDDETTFCDPQIVTNVIESKSIFSSIDKLEMRRARTRCNPYETIRGAFFLNRAAVKMANIDRACDFMFTKPNDQEKNELLYFADVCAGPGGFSEYVLWRKKWHAKGFGFTLRNENDFKLSDFYAGAPETFHPFYGPKGDGDVFDVSNQEAFRDLVMKHTHGKGVHFMMSDGGFSVEGQENIQEILSKQLYLCQCLVALMIVRPGGHFVTKLFDLFTLFSAGLIYLMYRCFDEVCLLKPNSSRPANSERYLICKGKRHDIHDVMDYLFRVNKILLKNDKQNDVMQLVPLEELEMEKHLINYLRRSNNDIGKKQLVGLLKIAAFYKDKSLFEPKQADMRKKCLEYWELPDESRTIPPYIKPQVKIKTLVKDFHVFQSAEPQTLSMENIKQTILMQPYDWLCAPCGAGHPGRWIGPSKMATFYMGMGRCRVYCYTKDGWVQLNKELKVELPPDTLIYAEMIHEATNEGRSQLKVPALHILDAYMLGGEDISKKYLPLRHELIRKFCEALWKPSPNDNVRVRAKEFYPFGPHIDRRIRLVERIMKNSGPTLTCDVPRTQLDDKDTPYFVPNSIIFLRSTARPWYRHYSTKREETYVYNIKTCESHFDIRRPATAEASFQETFCNSVIWYWPQNQTLSMDTVMQFVKEKCPQGN